MFRPFLPFDTSIVQTFFEGFVHRPLGRKVIQTTLVTTINGDGSISVTVIKFCPGGNKGLHGIFIRLKGPFA